MVKDIVIRQIVRPFDDAFIFDSWSRSLYPHFQEHFPKKSFFINQTKVIEWHLENSKTMLAVDKSSPEVILGYVVYDDRAVHYVYVKEVFRKYGIGKNLILETNLGGI